MKISSIKQQVKRADRYSIFVDGKYAFSLGESELLRQGLATGMELDANRLSALKQASGTDKAYGNALRYVAMRPRSQWEVEVYLQRKKVDEPIAAMIIQRLRDTQLLDDRTFARSWVASRRLLKSVSKRKLVLELKQKHIADEIIAEALQEDDTDDRASLRDLVEKKRARYPDDAKLMQYLARQGFGYDDIKSVLSEEQGD